MSVVFEKITPEQSWEIFDQAAQKRLSLSADEFVERWDRGDYADDSDTAVMHVAMLRPSGR